MNSDPFRSAIRLASGAAAILFCCAPGAFRAEAGADGLEPVTRAECQAFAERLTREMKTNRIAWIRELDPNALLSLAFRGVPMTADQANFRHGFKDTYKDALPRNLGAVGGYKLLRITSTNGDWNLFFRAFSPRDVPDYQELRLKRVPDGRVRVVDFYDAMTGEWYSSTIRRLGLHMLADSDGSATNRLTAAEKDMVRHWRDYADLTEKAQAEKWPEVMAIWRKLPESIQRENTSLMIRLQAAEHLGAGEYQATIAYWEQLGPKDAAFYLVSLKGHMLRKEHAKALAAIDRLDGMVGGDPYLNVLRAEQYDALGQPDEARQCLQKAMQAEPDLEVAYRVALAFSLTRKDYAETLRLLKNSSELGMDSLTRVDEAGAYKEFRTSEFYDDWKKFRSTPTK
jgi:tetratricopeptide (TPR) repeat protein